MESTPATPDTTPPPAEPDTAAPVEPSTVTESTPTPTGNEVAKWKELARKNEARAKENAEAAKRLAEIEESQKSETQKLQERAEVAEKAHGDATEELMRLRIAIAKGRPEIAARLRGSTEEEIAADADELLALLDTAKAPGVKPGDVLVGTRTPAMPAEDPDAMAVRLKARGLF
jgi:hypothetical protein